MSLVTLHRAAAAGLGLLMLAQSGAAQPPQGDHVDPSAVDTVAPTSARREHVIALATLDCLRLRRGPSPAEVAVGLVEAFANPRFGASPLPNRHIGSWDCRFRAQPPKGWSCRAVRGAPVSLLSRRVRLDFTVLGNCATFAFPGRNVVQLAPNRVGVRLGQSQTLNWQMTVDVGDPLARRQWSNAFEVRLAPPAVRR